MALCLREIQTFSAYKQTLLRSRHYSFAIDVAFIFLEVYVRALTDTACQNQGCLRQTTVFTCRGRSRAELEDTREPIVTGTILGHLVY